MKCDPRSLKCSCSVVSPNLFASMIHSLSHGNMYRCALCSKQIQRFQFSDLIAHIQSHRQSSAHDCPQCEQSFSKRRHLLTHKEHIHNSRLRYRCLICREELHPSEYRSHIKLHNKHNSHQCALCGQRFTNVKSLGLHIQLPHRVARSGEIIQD